MSCLHVKGGRVIDPANNRDSIGDVFVKDGFFVEQLEEDELRSAEVVDARGKIVCPGLVDLHAHLREPGDTAKERIASGTLAAAAGGFTTVVCMPNTKPPADNAGTIQLIRDAITRTARVNVLPMGCMTVAREGKQLAPMGSLARAGVVAVSDGGHSIQNTEIMRRATEYATMFGLPIMAHCEDALLTERGVMHEGEWSLRLGMHGMPRSAEDIMVARDAILAGQTKAHIHMQHISSKTALDIVRWARQSLHANITLEVTPHHLSLTHADLVNYDTHLKVVPPLRTEEDRQALIEGLLDGTVNCIATAHAPHTSMDKDREFDYAPFGINGLETAFCVAYQALVQAGHASLDQLIGWMTHKPAKIINSNRGTLTPAAPGDLIIIDLESEWTVTKEGFKSLSHNSPWLGKTLPGRVAATFVNGKCVYDLNRSHG